MPFVPANRLAAPASPQAWYFSFVQRELLLPHADGPEAGPLALLAPRGAAPWLDQALARHYLGRLSGVDCWAVALPQAPNGWRATPLRAAMLALDPELGALAGRAAQVLEWDRSHAYCGTCGTATVLKDGERARLCPACQSVSYPRLSPAMMALVWRPGALLLARSPHYAAGMYSALAGFVEAGESLEECVHREVAEEVGVTVRDLRYYGSQSWPFPHSLMVAFTARWAEGHIVAQPEEIEDAQWFALDALPQIPPRFSIAGHLIRDSLAAMQSGALT